MTSFEWEALRRDKEAFHRHAAERPFGEKLAQLDRLRERAAALKREADRAPDGGRRPGTASARKKRKQQ